MASTFDYLPLFATTMSNQGSSSPGSPTLTHASSQDDPLDAFLDLSSFDDGNAQVPQILTEEQSQELFKGSQDMQDLFAQYYGEKPAMDSTPDSSINPLLLDATVASTPDSDVDMASDADPEEEPAVQTKRKRAAPTKRKAQPKRKAKSTVADLALPLDDDAAHPVQVQSMAKDAQGHLPHIVFPVPDYIDRPAPEEYAKLSSKEKRQLRNKISARNFRHRRKEYITTLEGEIADRDQAISALSEEVTTLRTENTTLRSDMDLLKKTVDQLLNKARPAEHPPAAPVEPKFDAQKDRSPFASTSWQTFAAPNINVHTTFVPAPSTALFAPTTRRNVNPLMDKLATPSSVFHLPGRTEDDSFLGSNPFTLDGASMDRYRAQLYSKVTHNLAPSGAPGFKPSFFTAPATQSEADAQVLEAATRQTALVAHEARSTLAAGLLKSFWATFTGSNPHAQVELLAGRAELKVVPVVPAPARENAVEELGRGLAGLAVAAPTTAAATTSGTAAAKGQSSALAAFGGRKA